MMAYGRVRLNWHMRSMWVCFQACGCGFFLLKYRMIYFAYLLKVNDIYRH